MGMNANRLQVTSSLKRVQCQDSRSESDCFAEVKASSTASRPFSVLVAVDAACFHAQGNPKVTANQEILRVR